MPPPAVPQPPWTAPGTITTTPTTGTAQPPVPAIWAGLPWFPLPASPSIVHYLWWTRLPPQTPTRTGALPSPTTLLPGIRSKIMTGQRSLPNYAECSVTKAFTASGVASTEYFTSFFFFKASSDSSSGASPIAFLITLGNLAA